MCVCVCVQRLCLHCLRNHSWPFADGRSSISVLEWKKKGRKPGPLVTLCPGAFPYSLARVSLGLMHFLPHCEPDWWGGGVGGMENPPGTASVPGISR